MFIPKVEKMFNRVNVGDTNGPVTIIWIDCETSCYGHGVYIWSL